MIPMKIGTTLRRDASSRKAEPECYYALFARRRTGVNTGTASALFVARSSSPRGKVNRISLCSEGQKSPDFFFAKDRSSLPRAIGLPELPPPSRFAANRISRDYLRLQEEKEHASRGGGGTPVKSDKGLFILLGRYPRARRTLGRPLRMCASRQKKGPRKERRKQRGFYRADRVIRSARSRAKRNSSRLKG